VSGPVRRPLQAVGETSDGSRERAPEVVMDVPLWAWVAVLAVILAMLAVDLVAHRSAHVVSVREAAGWTAIWVSLGLAFGGVVWWAYGSQAGGEYFAGYLIEKSLAVDNVFVFALIFSYFAVPREYQHRVLFYGVIGALVFRAIFIAGGAVVIEQFAWVLYLFGAFLVFTGWKMFTHRNDEMDPSRNPALRLVRRRVPSTEEYHGQKFWVKSAGRWVATPLFTVLVLVETTDIIFAVDSIPAIFAVTQEPFLVFTSNAFAILGLRAMYFLLADLIHRFVYLKAGLAAILVLVGVKMLLLDVWKVPIWLSLAGIATILAGAVGLSLRATRHRAGEDRDAARDGIGIGAVHGDDGEPVAR
jgi:tellurite resistance protein TerC